MDNNKELVPVLKVLDDMHNDYSLVQYEARQYYYKHYATDAEKKSMDTEDKVCLALGVLLFGSAPMIIIGNIIASFL